MSLYCLPGLELTFSADLSPLEIVLVAGGRSPDRAWLRAATARRSVWAVDGGLDACLSASVEPARLIGDGDSARPASWERIRTGGIPIDRYPVEKDLTDLQIALKTLGEEKRGGALVTGCWGGRFDHLFSNVFSLMGSWDWGAGVRCMGDQREFLVCLKGEETLALTWETPPTVISLLALSSACRDVSIGGVKWPLSKASLDLCHPYAISNEPVADELNLSVGEGHLGLYLTWESPKKEGC